MNSNGGIIKRKGKKLKRAFLGFRLFALGSGNGVRDRGGAACRACSTFTKEP